MQRIWEDGVKDDTKRCAFVLCISFINQGMIIINSEALDKKMNSASFVMALWTQ